MNFIRQFMSLTFAACLFAWLPAAHAAESIVSVQASILIKRDLKDVFSYVSDVQNDIHWRGGIVSTRQTTPGPTRIGSRTEEVLKAFGYTIVTVTEIVDLVPPRRMLVRSVEGPAPVTVERTLVPSGTGTVFTYALRSDISKLPLLSFFRPVVEWHYQRQVEGFLRTLQAKLESEVGPANVIEGGSAKHAAAAAHQHWLIHHGVMR
jgi:hypothetical protein